MSASLAGPGSGRGGASASHWFWKGVRQALAGPAWAVGISYIGIGGLAHDVDFPIGVAVFSTLLVWAGPAQLIFFGGVASGAPALALATAVSLSGVRLLPMIVALLPHLRHGRTRLPALFLAGHLCTVTAWVEGMRRMDEAPPPLRIPHFIGIGAACCALATAMTFVGYRLAEYLPLALAAGLLFLSPIYFALALIRNAREAMDWTAVCAGFLLAPLMQASIGQGLDLLGVGLLGGLAGYSVRLWERRRR